MSNCLNLPRLQMAYAIDVGYNGIVPYECLESHVYLNVPRKQIQVLPVFGEARKSRCQ